MNRTEVLPQNWKIMKHKIYFKFSQLCFLNLAGGYANFRFRVAIFVPLKVVSDF